MAVAVVGAGPVGLSLARALGRAGVDTVVIESGREDIDGFAESLAPAEAIAPPHHVPVEKATHRRLGGASWIWGGRCVDYDPIDFEPRRDSEAPGWPITHADATAEASEAAAFLGIGEPRFEAPLDGRKLGAVLAARLERWCADPRLARVHLADFRVSENVRIYTGLTCTGLLIDESGNRVRGLRAETRAGREHRVTARHYVIAAGGIESARLLLASPEIAAAEIGPGTGWLGRGYMGHIQGSIADIILDRLAESDIDYRCEAGRHFVRSRLTIAPDMMRSRRLLNIAFLADNPPLGDWRHGSSALSAAALALAAPVVGRLLQPSPIREMLLGRPLGPRDIARHMGNVARDLPGATMFAARSLRARFARPRRPGAFVHNPGRRYVLKYFAEHSPLRESRVTLSRTRDALGLPRVSIDKHVARRDIKSVLDAHEVLDGELRRLKLGRLEFRGERDVRRAAVAASAADGYHQIGLARMGTDAKTSVVDRHCAVHGFYNLHVAGSAVLPTSGQANPTFLSVCLALRLARRLIATLKDGMLVERVSSAPKEPEDRERHSCQDV